MSNWNRRLKRRARPCGVTSASKGPVDAPTLVSSEAERVAKFGPPTFVNAAPEIKKAADALFEAIRLSPEFFEPSDEPAADERGDDR